MTERTAHPQLPDIAKRHGVALMYLFGSQREAGWMRLRRQPVALDDPLADVDLGVVFRHGLPGLQQRPSVYAALYNELSELLLPLRLDLVFVQETHVVFQGQVIQGLCIYAEDEAFRCDFEERVARYAADFRPVLERALDEALEEV